MKKFFALSFIVFMACDSSEPQEELAPEIVAEAQIHFINQVGTKGYEMRKEVVGKASFYQTGEVVTIQVFLSGMTPNTSKAVHIHEGSVERPGNHWNAGKFIRACDHQSLGTVWKKSFIGDVGNIAIDSEGKGTFSLSTDLWRINSGDDRDLLNRPIIIHENPQDFIVECDPAHDHNHSHSNVKIGGGKITLVSDITQNVQSFVPSEKMPDFLICK